MGPNISPLSGYCGGQYNFSVLVWKDPNDENWWMQFGNDYALGFW